MVFGRPATVGHMYSPSWGPASCKAGLCCVIWPSCPSHSLTQGGHWPSLAQLGLFLPRIGNLTLVSPELSHLARSLNFHGVSPSQSPPIQLFLRAYKNLQGHFNNFSILSHFQWLLTKRNFLTNTAEILLKTIDTTFFFLVQISQRLHSLLFDFMNYRIPYQGKRK